MLARGHSRPAKRFRLALLASVSCATIGCKVGPDYREPMSTVRSEWNLASQPIMQGAPAAIDQWWTHFDDPALQGLVYQSISQNLTLREAGERICEARARRGVTAGALYPQFQALQGSYNKARLSSNVPNFITVPPFFVPDLSPNQWQVGLAASWEIDFWGKYRRAIEVADARLNASIATYDEARVLLLAELATTYIEMRMAESRSLLALQNLEIQRKTLQIAEDKKAAGLGTGLDIAQAKINVGTTSAVLPTLETARLQASHRLCTLLGRPPVDLAQELGYTGIIPQPPGQLCFGIPADLVRRRPDVRRAEQELAAQSARIGIAQSDFYPQISLNGNIGYAAEDFGKLFASRSSNGLISPNFTWNLLNYGRIKNNVEAEKAALRALCHNYQNAVLNAAREAEDAQVAYVYGHDRVQSLQMAVDGARDAVEKAESLYDAGSVDFGRVYVLQAGLLEQQDALAQSQAAISLSLVDMFKSLGGGWDCNSRPSCSHMQLVNLPTPPLR